MKLATYATIAENTKGRLYPQKEYAERTCFQRDRDRIIHSEAFRRLESKTQVFIYHEGNRLRTRLTHSLEVAQITRSLCRMLCLNQDLGEALALGHDLGHPPFGHAGEVALNECTKRYGGFDHNANSLKIVTKLETRYPAFDGINLCWETLEGMVKHNGPLIKNDADSLPLYIVEYNKKHDLQLHTYPGLEAQVASLADDIAYCNHDTDDGIKTGFISIESLMAEVPFFDRHFAQVKKEYPHLTDMARLSSETVRRMINDLIHDVATVTEKNLKDIRPQTVEDVRNCGQNIVGFSDSVREDMKILKSFLFTNMYRHYKINQMTSKGKRILRDLFSLFFEENNILPTEIQAKIRQEERQTDDVERVRAVIIADFIAGLTDATAIAIHARLFDAQTRI